MNDDLAQKLAAQKEQWPQSIGSGVDEDAIAAAEASLGGIAFPGEYKEFLDAIGGGMIGGIGVFGLEMPEFMAGYLVTESTRKFAETLEVEGLPQSLVIGIDPVGSPICLSLQSGVVFHFDLDSGETEELAAGFDLFLSKLLNGHPFAFM